MKKGFMDANYEIAYITARLKVIPPFRHILHCSFDHKNYEDWKLRDPCMEKLYYLWKRAVRIERKPHDNYRT